MLICDITVIVDLLWLRFMAYSGYFRLSVYKWGIFLAYVHRRLSLRLCFHVFWEAGHDRDSLVSESGLLKKDLVNTGNLKQTIVIILCTYTIYTMILTPLGIDCPHFENPSL